MQREAREAATSAILKEIEDKNGGAVKHSGSEDGGPSPRAE